MKNLFIFAGLIVFVGLSIYSSKVLQSKDPDIISTKGIHWHPELEIFVDGVKYEIPEDLGIGVEYASSSTYNPSMGMTQVHTHDDLPLIHFEFSGIVRKSDTRLGEFFAIWGKDFMSFGDEVVMTVNGVETQEYGNYEMKDGDKIVLRYTTNKPKVVQ